MMQLTETEKKQIWEEVRREFPDDEMMQEIHYVRLLHFRQMEGLSSQERIRFFARSEEEVLAYSQIDSVR